MSMVKAIWKDVVVAQSNDCEIIERNYYFPPDSIKQEYFKKSDTHSICFWKGRASYYNIEIDGEVNQDAAWYYPSPKDAAKNIKNYIAFWKGVEEQK